MVKRSEVLEYAAPSLSNDKWCSGSSEWHRIYSVPGGKIAVSNLTCFCSHCRNALACTGDSLNKWKQCLFIQDTDGVDIKVPVVDVGK